MSVSLIHYTSKSPKSSACSFSAFNDNRLPPLSKKASVVCFVCSIIVALQLSPFKLPIPIQKQKRLRGKCHCVTMTMAPLMLAAMHWKISCVQKLIAAGANILKFDFLCGRTCLHYAAYYGHSKCLKVILSAARTSHVAASWGFARFLNVSDGRGATPLHLADRQKWPDCIYNGASVCASTGGYGVFQLTEKGIFIFAKRRNKDGEKIK